MKSNKRTTSIKSIFIHFVLLAVGFGLGIGTKTFLAPRYASAQEIEKAKNEIVALYKDKAVGACWQVNKGARLGNGKYELTYRNIRINRLANRAIVTDCGEFDTLLAKNSYGKWVATTVNIMIFNRANPVWQEECQIEDITVADDKVRPENDFIDQLNLEECKKLDQQ